MENPDNYSPEHEEFLRLCSHHEPTVKKIYDDCYSDTRRMVKKYRGKEEDAEDIFQEALLIALTYCGRSSFRLERPICAFLYGISSRVWWKKLRENGRLDITFKDFAEYIDLKHVIELREEDMQKAERFRLTWKHLHRLPERGQQLLTKFYLEDKPFREIAEEMGFSNANSAKVQKYKYLQQLRAFVREDPDFE